MEKTRMDDISDIFNAIQSGEDFEGSYSGKTLEVFVQGLLKNHFIGIDFMSGRFKIRLKSNTLSLSEGFGGTNIKLVIVRQEAEIVNGMMMCVPLAGTGGNMRLILR